MIMKNNYLRLAVMLFLAACSNAVNAEDAEIGDSIVYDFYEVNADGDTIWYKITSEEDKTCEVTFNKGEVYIIEEPDEEDEDTYVYVYPTDTLRYVGTINIPSSATNGDNGETYKVVGIGEDAFLDCIFLTGVILPETIGYIRTTAFARTSITSIDLPEGIDSIFYAAFIGTPLKTINIPTSLKYIDNSFYCCDSLTSITVDPSNEFFSDVEGVLYNYDKTKLLRYPANKEGNTYKVVETCEILGSTSFQGAKKLERVYLNEGLDTLDSNTFESCSSLDSIYIPSTVRCIYDGSVFVLNTSLATLEVDEKNPYYVSVDNVIFSKDTTELVAYAIGNERTFYSIPNTVKKIGLEAFVHYLHLKKIEIPESVDTIGFLAFACADAVCMLDTIVCRAEEPAKIDTISFWNLYIEGIEYNGYVCYDNTVLVVPDGTEEKYRSTTWGLFKNIVEEREITGINEINAENIPTSVTTDERIYDLQGRRLDVKPENGVYIRGGKKIIEN